MKKEICKIWDGLYIYVGIMCCLWIYIKFMVVGCFRGGGGGWGWGWNKVYDFVVKSLNFSVR